MNTPARNTDGRAAWSMTVRKRSVDETGTVHLVADLLDGGVAAMTLDLTVDAARNVRLMVRGEPGARLGGFQAWSDF